MTHLKKGDKAPDFKGVDQDGNEIGLNDFKGKKVVLYFYPKDMTPGCTAQACNLAENYDALQKAGYTVIGVSADPLERHRKFADKYHLPFRLLADVDKKIIRAYGVWGPKKLYGREYEGIHRETFVIGEDGTIEKVISKVKTKDHASQILSD